jgi:hypothetical protein
MEQRLLPSFLPPVSYPIAHFPQAIAAGDFNGDGNLDLAITSHPGVTIADLSLLLGNGDGTFRAGAVYQTGLGPEVMALGDFNGDGNLDLVTADFSSKNVSLLLGNGDGTFRVGSSYFLGSTVFPWSLAVAELNGDHKLDVVVGDSQGSEVEQISPPQRPSVSSVRPRKPLPSARLRVP